VQGVKLTPKGWRDFQHYKDRSPPWIRLHRKLLDNKDYHRLPVESRALAPMLWLLASESVDGVIDATLDDLAFRLRSTEEAIRSGLLPLVERGFFALEHDASNVLQRAVPETETEAEREADAEALTEAEASHLLAGRASRTPTTRRADSAPTGPVWSAYSEAYERRYSVAPLRNAKVNGQLAQLLGRVPVEEAPMVAAYYVTHQGRFYVEKGHAVDYLLRDAEKLRTEWATRRQVTSTQAQQADRTQSNANAFGPMIEEARRAEAGNG
jgi:hypothetical protein